MEEIMIFVGRLPMTRKHFKALAEALKNVQPAEINSPIGRQWERDTNVIAEVLARFNSRFDQQRFVKACGYGI